MFLARIAVCCRLFAALSACAVGRQATEGNAMTLNWEDLAGRAYYLVSMDGKSFEGARAPELSFSSEARRVSGSVCNRFGGAAKIVNGMLMAENMASTRMACFQPFLNEAEQALFDMLQSGAQLSLDGRRVTLTGGGHTLV
jgi:heat shock protein HslJ